MGMMLIPGHQLPPPAKCASCGDTDRDCIDFGVTLEMYGAVLICTLCMRSAAVEFPRAIGLIDIGIYHSLSDEYDKLARERGVIPELVEDVRNELFDIINSLSDRLSRYREQFSDEQADVGDDGGSVSTTEETERQADSDAGFQGAVGVPSHSGDGTNDPFRRTDF